MSQNQSAEGLLKAVVIAVLIFCGIKFAYERDESERETQRAIDESKDRIRAMQQNSNRLMERVSPSVPVRVRD